MIAEDETPTVDQLIQSHLRLVFTTVSRKYPYSHPLFDDLIQVGNMALMQSAKSFDPSNGVSFASYAIPWIKMAIMNHVLDNSYPIRMLTSKPIRKAFFNRLKYMTEKGLDKERMAEELGISVETITEMEMRMECRYLSIDMESDDGDSTSNPFDPVDPSGSPSDLLMRLEFDQFIDTDVTQAISELSDRQRFVIENRFCVDKPMILKDVAAIFGVSCERIRQIEQEALKKLKNKLAEKYEAHLSITEA